ncbi:MAG: hypothetical protein K2J46_06255, partial [Muribaculaceae bacterium]|nr:hypothetical protein [Muribaculaceae bacterium]
KVRSLGLSNFDAADSLYMAALEFAKLKPAVMQIECHPYAQRRHSMRALDKEQRFFNMDYKEAEQFMLNWKMDD